MADAVLYGYQRADKETARGHVLRDKKPSKKAA
jgi:hypothetical protein